MSILLLIASIAVVWTALSILIVAVGVGARRRKEDGDARAWAGPSVPTRYSLRSTSR